METTLPTETALAGPESPAGARTDGLAAQIALEHDAGNEAGPVGTAKRIGRPPVHGRYSKAAGSDGKNPVPVPGSEQVPAPEVLGTAPESAPRIVIPPDLLAEVVQESLTLAEVFASTKIEGVALRAGLEQNEIMPQLRQAAIGDRRKELVGKLAPMAIEEWGLDPELSPTAAIAVLLGPWAFAAISAYWTLAKLGAEKAAREKLGTKA